MKKIIDKISIVIPVLNEERNIINLLDELKKNLINKIKFEIIIVDDGSTDKTIYNIKRNIKRYDNLTLIS